MGAWVAQLDFMRLSVDPRAVKPVLAGLEKHLDAAPAEAARVDAGT
ncbi:MAG: hypothetical protein R2748_06995 [Bryobacterales bacterium]